MNSFAFLFIASFIFVGCQNKPVVQGRLNNQRPTSQTGSATPSTNIGDKNNESPLENKNYVFEESEPEAADPNVPMAGGVPPGGGRNQNLKIGLILGPGAAKTYAHIGVLQELQKQKIPIHAVVGVEFAAPMAALFAWKGFANDVEWQMFKLKDEDISNQGLLSGGKPADVSSLKDFMKNIFHGLRAEDLKKPFGCPSFNMSKGQNFILSRGSLEQMLPYCMPYLPVTKPFSQSISGLRDVNKMVTYLRSQGANYIVIVNVLGGSPNKKSSSDLSANTSWAEIAYLYSEKNSGVDGVINLNLDNYGLGDFSMKREIKNKGTDLSAGPIKAMAERLGF